MVEGGRGLVGMEQRSGEDGMEMLDGGRGLVAVVLPAAVYVLAALEHRAVDASTPLGAIFAGV